MDRFNNFSELTHHATAGKDFIIEVRGGSSGIAIMAPHGGGIEPGTDVVADIIAGNDHAYYAFKGIRPKLNTRLHITSNRFDEPCAINLTRISHTIVTIHGCRSTHSMVYVGGRNDLLKNEIASNLKKIMVPTSEAPAAGLKGVHPKNLCNRGIRGQGVQLEISNRLRSRLIGSDDWRHPLLTPQLRSFAQAIRQAL